MKSDSYEFEIQGVMVGRERRPYVLAEIGINHGGDVELAVEMILAAGESGADGVKFQTFKASERAHPEKAPDQYAIFKKVELDRDAHVRLREFAMERGIAFISTPFGIAEADMLAEIGVPAFKIASGDLTNHALLQHVGSLGRSVILSTGMSYMGEVCAAREMLLNAGCEHLAILHCVSRYPTEPEDLNLRAIESMLAEFPEVIGFSDHTMGIWAAPAAVGMGARFIEKHFTLDRTLPGPDHALSVEPGELKALVEAVRNTFHALGDGIKQPCPIELEKRHLGRKGFYAARTLEKGAIISADDIKISRPQGNVPATEYANIIGQVVLMDLAEGDEITRDSIGSG
jgi:N,N'-diacetyllegionaminate synthase